MAAYQPIKISSLSKDEREFVYGASRITLCQEAAGEPGRQYLTKRGIGAEAIARFRLGFVPSHINHPFAGRLVFPIFDLYDQLIALSVRPITDEYEGPKYWNESFPKSEHLYGMSVAKHDIARSDLAIIVEGQCDVLSMHSHAIRNAMGLLGGAFTPMHAVLIWRLASHVVFLFDCDAAGRKHAERARTVMETYEAIATCSLRTGKHSVQRKHVLKYCVTDMNNELNNVAAEGKDPASFLARYGARKLMLCISASMIRNGMEPPK